MTKEEELIKYLEGLSKDEIIGITIREFNENRYFREVKIGEYLKENQQLHNKIDKVIKYINNSWTGGYTDATLKYKVEEINITELLEILKESDVDE